MEKDDAVAVGTVVVVGVVALLLKPLLLALGVAYVWQKCSEGNYDE